jgi:hypothetical protein
MDWKRPNKCESSACVEVYIDTLSNQYLLRDSKYPQDCLVFTQAEWSEFITAVKDGEYD